MVKEEGTVIEINDGEVIVAVLQTSACQSCRAKQGCGQAVLSEWGDADRQEAKNHFAIPYQGTLQPGDKVTLGIEEDTLSMAALWMYLWPLLCAFAALLATAGLNWAEPYQLLAALVGGALAFLVTRRRFQRVGQRWVPQILATHPMNSALIAKAE